MLNIMLTFAKRFARPEWPWYAGGLVFLALTNYLTLKIPLLAKEIVNGINDVARHSDLAETALYIVMLGIFLIVIRSLSRIMIFWPGRKIEANAKAEYFERLMVLPQTFFDKFGLGDLISRLANDIGHLRVFFAFALLQAANLAFLLLFTINQMMQIHTRLTIACLTPLVLMLLIARYINPLMYRFSRESQVAIAALTNRVTESLVNVHVVQANAATKPFLDKIEVDNEAVYKTNMKVLIVRQILWPLMTLLGGIAQVVVLLYGGFEVAAGNITLGDIMAFNVYIGYLAFPLSALGIVLAIYQRSVAALERVIVIDEELPEQAQTGCTPTEESPNLLEVKNLNFRFFDEEKSEENVVLSDISFTVGNGEHVGLFGGIGSGKTILMDLISRLRTPDKGSIYFDSQDIVSYEPHELRQKIGYGLQVPQLFSDSIAENLQLGLDPKVSQEVLEQITDGAQILNEIKNFTEGWETTIGEKGIRLSGGQKQRLALARTFLRNPQLLLLDDVLSAVDHVTERALIEFVHSFKCSLLISSHRPSILKACDKVIILDDGKLIAQGTYTALVDRFPQLSDHSEEN